MAVRRAVQRRTPRQTAALGAERLSRGPRTGLHKDRVPLRRCATEILLLYAAFNMVEAILGYAAGHLSDRVGRKPHSVS